MANKGKPKFPTFFKNHEYYKNCKKHYFKAILDFYEKYTTKTKTQLRLG